jgi:hypothetical protein
MNAKFTPRRKYFRVAITCLPFFVVMLVASVIGMYVDAPPDRRVAAIVGVIVGWGFFVALTVYLLLAYSKEATILGDEEVRFVRVFTDQTVRLADVRRARWYCYGKPWRLKIAAPGCKRTIWFDNFYPDQNAEIVRYFLERLNPSVQEGWDESLETLTWVRSRMDFFPKFIASMRKLTIKVLVLGPLLGLACGAILQIIAQAQAVPAPAWSGSVFLDWTLYGLLATAGLLALIWWSVWVEWPEESPASNSP